MTGPRIERRLSTISEPNETAGRRERMGSLATLPVFFDLRGKRVVMTGGGAGAAWKTELLAASGAKVDLYVEAGEIGEDMAELLAAGPVDGSIRHHDRSWGVDIFQGAAIAVGDVESEAEAKADEQATADA